MHKHRQQGLERTKTAGLAYTCLCAGELGGQAQACAASSLAPAPCPLKRVQPDCGVELRARVQADLSDPTSLPAALVGVHTIIDCATARPEESTEQVDWEGKVALIQCAQAMGIQR